MQVTSSSVTAPSATPHKLMAGETGSPLAANADPRLAQYKVIRRNGAVVAFEPSNEAIDFRAEADTEFVLGSAASHPYELALGFYSVHTSRPSLQAGERRIAEIKVRLQKQGRL